MYRSSLKVVSKYYYLCYHNPFLKTSTCMNLQVSGNTAGGYGGGIYATGSLTMTNSTVAIVCLVGPVLSLGISSRAMNRVRFEDYGC